MSYLANIAFSLELIALAVGFWILNKSKSNEVHCAKSTKIIGFVIVIGSLANIACTLTNTIKDYMTEDGPRRGNRMERMMDNNQGMPGNMMMQNSMPNNMQQAPMQNNQQMMQQMPNMQNQQMPPMQNNQMPNGQMPPPPNGQMGNPGGQPPPPPMGNGQ